MRTKKPAIGGNTTIEGKIIRSNQRKGSKKKAHQAQPKQAGSKDKRKKE